MNFWPDPYSSYWPFFSGEDARLPRARKRKEKEIKKKNQHRKGRRPLKKSTQIKFKRKENRDKKGGV
jgi:hypothetical protein